MLDPAQLRAARALLAWRQEDLSQRAKVGVATIRRIETQHGPPAGNIATYDRLQRALEAAGVIFIPADDQAGPGVRLARQPPQSHSAAVARRA